jgi:hypothetical protein
MESLTSPVNVSAFAAYAVVTVSKIAVRSKPVFRTEDFIENFLLGDIHFYFDRITISNLGYGFEPLARTYRTII